MAGEPGSTTLHTDCNKRDKLSVTNSAKYRKRKPRQIKITYPWPHSKSAVCAVTEQENNYCTALAGAPLARHLGTVIPLARLPPFCTTGETNLLLPPPPLLLQALKCCCTVPEPGQRPPSGGTHAPGESTAFRAGEDTPKPTSSGQRCFRTGGCFNHRY